MNYVLLHIFRNTPFGRETFLQSLYFCKTIKARPVVYIPESDKFLIYFDRDTVQVDLDQSYLTAPETAKANAEKLFDEMGLSPSFYVPKNYTASTLPDVSPRFDYLCCPRSVSDLTTKIGLGHIGSKVRRIVQHARFPVLITSPVFKPWQRISVLFGGSENAVNALKLGLKLSIASGMEMDVFTLMEKGDKSYYGKIIEQRLPEELAERVKKNWFFYAKADFDTMLYDIRHDSMVVLGAYGHGPIKDLLFGSILEKIQSTIGNPLLVTGPENRVDFRH